MKVILDKEGVKEFFKQYATESLKTEVRQVVREELRELVKSEIETKLNNLMSNDKLEAIMRDVLKKDIFKNHWLHEKDYPTEEMVKILLEEFKSKAKNVKFNNIEELMIKEAREMLESKVTKFKNIIKFIDKAK